MAETELQIKRQKEIIDAASQIFSSVGFHRADMNDIAKLANIAKGTVYLYFPSKKKLFLAVIFDGLKNLADNIEDVVNNSNDPIEEFKNSIVAYINFFKENQPYYRILLHPEKEVKEDIENTWHNYTLSKIPTIEDTLNKCVEHGLFKKINTKSAAHMILGMIDQTIGLWISDKKNESIESMTEQVLEIIFKGIEQ